MSTERVQLPYGPHASTPYYGRDVEPYGAYGAALKAARAAGTQPDPAPEPGGEAVTPDRIERDLRRRVRYRG
jgi:hypothetical protein